MSGFVYDQAAFEAFCAELVRAGFSPTVGSEGHHWTGAIPESIEPLTDARVMEIAITDGWPAVAAKAFVPGLIADHVLPESGYICLWADDDPAQIHGQTWGMFSERLDRWAASARGGFELEDRALDSWVLFPGIAAVRAELDLPALLATPRNGDIHVVHGKSKAILTLTKNARDDHPLEGVVMYRDSVRKAPRSLDEFRAALTRRQRDNLNHGLGRRDGAAHGEASGGYDFAVLVWPKYGQFEALVLSFAGAGAELVASPHSTSPSDVASRLRRAGPDASILQGKRILVAGAGAVGGQVALSLACSGVGELHLRDDDDLRSVNLARHVLDDYLVGYSKTVGLSVRIAGSAPWCRTVEGAALPLDPEQVADVIRGFDLVVDSTGMFAATLALARACELENVPLVSVSLHRGGRLFRIQRQAQGDTPILQRTSPAYPAIPPGDDDETEGFLELGCTAPVHNAPPTAVLRAAADTALVAVELLAGRDTGAEDVVTVLHPIDAAPFNTRGSFAFPATDGWERERPNA